VDQASFGKLFLTVFRRILDDECEIRERHCLELTVRNDNFGFLKECQKRWRVSHTSCLTRVPRIFIVGDD
jgi:hypothetical protein